VTEYRAPDIRRVVPPVLDVRTAVIQYNYSMRIVALCSVLARRFGHAISGPHRPCASNTTTWPPCLGITTTPLRLIPMGEGVTGRYEST
jgi:hypothetical protein